MYTCTECWDDYDPVNDWCSCNEEAKMTGKEEVESDLRCLLPLVQEVYGPNAMLAVIDMEEDEFGEVVLEVANDEG